MELTAKLPDRQISRGEDVRSRLFWTAVLSTPFLVPTGWNIGEIRKAMNIASSPVSEEKRWYQRVSDN